MLVTLPPSLLSTNIPFYQYFGYKNNGLTCACPAFWAVAESHAADSPQPASNITSSNTAAAAAAAVESLLQSPL
jgi:hypothetical protein